MIPSPIDDPITPLAFSIEQNPGVYALLLGSGLSSAAGIATGWGITMDLVRRVAEQQGEHGSRSDKEWAAWFRARTGMEPDYSTLLAVLGRTGPERQSIVASYIDPTPEDRALGLKRPTAAHKAIARLVASGHIKVVVTTNFDRLLENALRDEGVEPIIIASADDLNGAPPLQHSRCTILKLHGDYLDVRSLNTADELAAYPAAIDQLLMRICDEYGLIIAGWSGDWDPALRRAINQAPSRRYTSWWTHRDVLSTAAQDLVIRRGAVTVPIQDADSLFVSLAEQVELITRIRRPPPASIELLLARTKRYLAKPEHTIDLADLVQDQVDRVAALLRSPDRDPVITDDAGDAAPRIQALDAHTEGLASMLYLVGRWGDGANDALALSALRDLYALGQRLPRVGKARYRALRAYPALLCYAMLRAGLVQSERWSVLHAVSEAPVQDDAGHIVPLGEKLLPTVWEIHGEGGSVWSGLPSLQDRVFQAHLRDRLAAWVRRLAGGALDVDWLLDWTDLLSAFLLYARNDAASGRPIRIHVGPWAQDGQRAKLLRAALTPAHPLVSKSARQGGLVDLYKRSLAAGAGAW